MDDDEGGQVPAPPIRLWDKPSTRRAVLAGAATVAAIGTTAAVIGVSQFGGGSDSTNKTSGPAATPTPLRYAWASLPY